MEQEQDRLTDRQREQAHDQRRQQPPHQIPVAEIADHRAADRHQHDMQRAAARPGEAPDRAAAQAIQRPGLRAAEHRHAGDADGEDAELDVKKPGSAEHNGWCGTSGIFTAEAYELGGIILLGRDLQTDYLEELNPSEKILRVMQRMISPAWTERQLSENLFFAGEIADRVPVLHLLCTKNFSAACVMKNTIDQLEELQ